MLTVPTWSAGHTATDLHLAASSLLEIDILTTAPSAPLLSPERRLWLAVIADAIDCLHFTHDSRGWLAKRWLLSPAFRRIADDLGWDATSVQARIADLAIHPPNIRFNMLQSQSSCVGGRRMAKRRRCNQPTQTGPAVASSRTGAH